MKSKKAILGNIMTTFIATIIIVVILVLFAIGSGIAEKVSHSLSAQRTAVDKEGKVGLQGVDNYFLNFQEITQVRFLISKDSTNNILKAIGDSGYDK